MINYWKLNVKMCYFKVWYILYVCDFRSILVFVEVIVILLGICFFVIDFVVFIIFVSEVVLMIGGCVFNGVMVIFIGIEVFLKLYIYKIYYVLR